MTHADIDVRYLNPDIEKLTYIRQRNETEERRFCIDPTWYCC